MSSSFVILVLMAVISIWLLADAAGAQTLTKQDKLNLLVKLATPSKDSPFGCINFSPWTDEYNPSVRNTNIPPAHIDTLLDDLIAATNGSLKCIAQYGLTNGEEYVLEAAKKRGLKVYMRIWLDVQSADASNIQRGIQFLQQYEDTVLAVSCGSELRVRHDYHAAEQTLQSCVQQIQAANLQVPVTMADTWWSYCSATFPCQAWTNAANLLDFLSINIFPIWDNIWNDLCITLDKIPGYHVQRWQQIQSMYPNKTVIISEYGHPSCIRPGHCNQASDDIQQQVIAGCLKAFNQAGTPAIFFVAYRASWKAQTNEGMEGPCWGVGLGSAPFTIKLPAVDGLTPVKEVPAGHISQTPSPGSPSNGGGGSGSADNGQQKGMASQESAFAVTAATVLMLGFTALLAL